MAVLMQLSFHMVLVNLLHQVINCGVKRIREHRYAVVFLLGIYHNIGDPCGYIPL